jgi:hypothetical protein
LRKAQGEAVVWDLGIWDRKEREEERGGVEGGGGGGVGVRLN